MARLIHLDAVGGVAGDMFVAALLDAFPNLEARVLADAAAVLPAHAGSLRIETGESGGIRACRFGLSTGGAPEFAPSDDHDHDRAEGDDGSYPAMAARIAGAALSPGTAGEAGAILRLLAEAEAEVHGVGIDDVHFHEIADWDSLADVVAAGSIAAALEGATWIVSSLPKGGGLVSTRHGLLPVPAPATAKLLQGFAFHDDGIGGERVTPTGAAILRHLVSGHQAGPLGRLGRSGAGAGTRTLAGLPNILRALVFDAAELTLSDRVTVIAFEIDDMTGEEIAVAAERLRSEAGVLDLSVGQRAGKKGRPMQSFRLLARPDAAAAVIGRCFAETSTIGLRVHDAGRVLLPRESLTAGGVKVKSVLRPGAGRTAKAESDELTGESLAERRALKLRAESESR